MKILIHIGGKHARMVDTHAGTIKGRRVIDNKGTNIGQVEDVTIDPSGWAVKGLLVNLDRTVTDNLHLKKPMMGGGAQLEISRERVDVMGETVILNVNTDEIAGLLREHE